MTVSKFEITQNKLKNCNLIPLSKRVWMETHLEQGCPLDTVNLVVDAHYIVDDVLKEIIGVGIEGLDAIKRTEIERVISDYVGL
jgi:hypothetical protein